MNPIAEFFIVLIGLAVFFFLLVAGMYALDSYYTKKDQRNP